MTHKHTPGPWIAELVPERGYFQINGEMHAIACNQFCYEPYNEANARLIAAAPQLLEALKAMVGYYGDDDPEGEEGKLTKIAKQAIALATGKDQ